MDIEQLKLILDTVGNAGEGTYTLGVLYILKGYFYGLVWLGIFWLLARIGISCIQLSSFGHQIGAAYGDDTRWGYPNLNEAEKSVVLTAIRGIKTK